MLVRHIDPENRRQRKLHLTAEGIDFLEQAKDGIYRLENRIFTGLTNEEAQQFMVLLQKMVDANNALSRAPLIKPPKK